MSTATTDNETSNDIMIVDSNDALIQSIGETAKKPLMILFLRLVGNDNKQNTVLTNAQIVDILQKEFDMDIVYTHELEIEVYLNLLKRYLKDWPQWDEFDFAINVMKDQKDIEKMKDMLQTNYEGLRSYLRHTIELVQPILNKVIVEVLKSTVKSPTHSSEDVAIVVQCTRMQLNKLFFRRPHPDLNHTILNIEAGPSKIRVQPISIKSILNWPAIQITLTLNGLLYKRELKHVVKHLLINKKLNYSTNTPDELNTNFQMKAPKVTSLFESQNFFDVIDKIRNFEMNYTENNLLERGIQTVCDVIKHDLTDAPQYLQSPANYRRNLSKYPYIRHLYSEVKSDKYTVNNYDLQLEETAIPQVHFQFMRFNIWDSDLGIQSDGSFLKIECVLCECIFTGINMFAYLQNHFDYHQGEQDWQCTHCKVVISMENLARSSWQHICQTQNMLD